MTYLVSLLFLLIASNAVAQVSRSVSRGPVAIVQSVAEPLGDGTDTVWMPRVVLRDKDLEARINYYLQYLILDGISSPQKFETYLQSCLYRSADSETHSGIDFLEFNVLRNNDRLLVIHIDGEGMGAYPSPFQIDCSIDLNRGTPIDARELFTTAGVEDVTKRVRQVREDSIKATLEFLRATPQEVDVDSQFIASIYDDFEECNQTIDYGHMQILQDSLAFGGFGCLAHVVQAFDIDWNVRLPIKEFLAGTNAYGNAMFGSSRYVGPEHPLYKSRLYRGTIGKAAVTLMLSNLYNDSYHGSYFYDDKGMPIELSGEMKGETLHLTEASESDVSPHLMLTQNGNTLRGAWTRGNGKPLPIELVRQ